MNALFARFKSAFGRTRLPVIVQSQSTDCGAAALAIVLTYFGRAVLLDEVRELMGVGRDGVSAGDILRTGRWYGLRGRGVRFESIEDDFEFLPAGTILHWEFNHFVVYERLSKNGVHIVDPAFGRRCVPLEQIRKSTTGVAIIFEPGERFRTAPRSRNRLWAQLRRAVHRTGLVPRVLVSTFLLQLFALTVPILTGVLVDRVLPSGDYGLLTVLIVVFTALVGFLFLATWVRAHLLLQLRTKLDSQMMLGFLEHLVDLPYAFFQRRSAGDLLNRLNSNVQIRDLLTSTLVSTLLDGGMVGLYLIVLIVAAPKLALLSIALGAAQVAVFLFSRRAQSELIARGIDAQVKSQNYLVQMLSGIETLKTSGTELNALEVWSDFYVSELNVSIEQGKLSALVEAVLTAMRIGAPLVILIAGIYRVLRGELTLGNVLAINAMALGFLAPLSSIVGAMTQFQTVGRYLARIRDVFDTAPEQRGERVTAPLNLKGEISIENVSYRHSRLSQLVVRNVSFEIRPGQWVAVVGASGSGKSTLARLLVGLYRPTSGRILYDQTDLSTLDARSVRNQLGIVVQQPYLFGASVRQNIALANPNASLDDVIAAAKLACIHDDIMEMPLNYDTPITDGGSSLSGGQRQRIVLARALLPSPPVLLLDEATSALDAETEADVLTRIESLGCTRIVIAHRLSSVIRADVIVVLADGELIERGTHDELMRRNGRYRRLVAAQLRDAPTPVT